MSVVLKALKIKEIEIINYYLQLNSFAHPESKVGQKKINFRITKENVEQWIVQALNAESIGAGSYPVDIKTDNFLADLKSMSIKIDKNGNVAKAESGETSLAQKFKTEENLDILFQHGKAEKIKTIWSRVLYDKYKTVVKEHKIDKIYYIFIMRANKKYYLFMTSVDYESITNLNLEVDKQRSTKDSVFIKNMIDEKFGNVKIYKAKKRMELRLNPKYFIDNGYCIEFLNLTRVENINLRETNLKKYIKKKNKKIFLNYILIC